MGDGAETGRQRRLADGKGRICEQRFGFLDPSPADVFGKGHVRGLFEQTAEIRGAELDVLRCFAHRQLSLGVGPNKVLRLRHGRRLVAVGGKHPPVRGFSQLLREQDQQPHHGAELFLGNDGDLKVRPSQGGQILVRSPGRKCPGDRAKTSASFIPQKDLAAEQRGHMLAAHQDGHGHIRQARETAQLLRREFSAETLLELFLDFQAGPASSADFDDGLAEQVFLPPERNPFSRHVRRGKPQRKTRGPVKGCGVVVRKLRSSDGIVRRAIPRLALWRFLHGLLL